jgi:glutaredoxin
VCVCVCVSLCVIYMYNIYIYDIKYVFFFSEHQAHHAKDLPEKPAFKRIYICNQCNILKNLLDEKGIQYHYVDVSKIPHELLTYLRMYCNTYPIVLIVKYFSTFNETLEYFKDF